MRIPKTGVFILLLWCARLACAVAPPGDIGVGASAAMDFVRDAAKATALAPVRDKNAVKFLALGMETSGVVVVTTMALGNDHNPPFTPPAGTIALAHVHTGGMSARPEAADYAALRATRLPTFIISADGEAIWEIAVIGGVNQYRAVLPSGAGAWVDF